MKLVKDLVVPLGDAENYRTREDKAFFNDAYFKTEYLDSLLDPHKYFLCGDKGTGKTAMAVYLHNNDYKDTRSDHVFIRATEIRELTNLRQAGRLALPDMQLLWETSILLRVARLINADTLANGWIERYSLLSSIKAILEKYYEERQNPEIKVDIEILKNRSLAAKLAANGVLAGATVTASAESENTTSYTHFRDLVYAVNSSLKRALEKAKYAKRVLVLLDGLDNRPEEMSQVSYVENLRALGQAVWSLNADFFSSIKDVGFRPKIVLLMRPEIVDLLSLSNSALKMRDNAVELDWLVNDESSYKNSKLYKMIVHVLEAQQPLMSLAGVDVWKHYFDYRSAGHDSFPALLRRTYHRPRDVVTYIGKMQEVARTDAAAFSVEEFQSPEVERKYSEYLLSEIRNGLEYALSQSERNLIPLFFKSFKGRKRVAYEEFVSIHADFIKDASRRRLPVGDVFGDANQLLQLLYENNIVAYIERTEGDRSYVRWFFRERTLGDPRPLVQFDEVYIVHDGLGKALDLGVRKVAHASVVKGSAESKKPRRRRGGRGRR